MTTLDQEKQAVESEAQSQAIPKKAAVTGKRRHISAFASVQLSVLLMSLMAITVLVGAWCPQESQVGQEKVFEAFSRDQAEFLIRAGISDIFHTPWFIALTAMMTINMLVVSFQRVFPKVLTLNKEMPFFRAREIKRLPVHRTLCLKGGQETAALAQLSALLTRSGYKVRVDGRNLKAEYGKLGRLAPTTTHIGLLSLLLGVTITSWTGFNGFEPILLDEALDFKDAKHAKLWVGKLPDFTCRVDATRRENYPTGEAKQWFSTLSVVRGGKVVSTQEISVNNPLSFEGVDVYQSSWGLAKLEVSFNGNKRVLDLNPMGQKYACFLPLDPDTVMIMSLQSEGRELRVFAKRKNWEAPKLLGVVPVGQGLALGEVMMKFERVIPITGLQYKCDPGLPVTYFAFAVIMIGVLLASIPHRHVWASVDSTAGDSGEKLLFGGTSRKAKVGFELSMDKLYAKLEEEFSDKEKQETESKHA